MTVESRKRRRLLSNGAVNTFLRRQRLTQRRRNHWRINTEQQRNCWRRRFLCGPPGGYAPGTETELQLVQSSRDCEWVQAVSTSQWWTDTVSRQNMASGWGHEELVWDEPQPETTGSTEHGSGGIPIVGSCYVGAPYEDGNEATSSESMENWEQ
jgi:hypothetical protein